MREQFTEWLLNQGKSQNTARAYASWANAVARDYAEQTGKDIGGFYEISDINLISEISRQYSREGEYSHKGDNSNGGWRAAINRYAEFAVEQLVQNDEEPMHRTANMANAEADVTPANFQYERDLQTAFCSQISSLFSDYIILGREYQIQTRRIDVFLKHKNKEEFLVVELKAGQASEAVFGQISSYIGMLKQNPEFSNKKIEGVIVAGAISNGLRYACQTNPNISVKTYRMTLELEDSDMPESEDTESEE